KSLTRSVSETIPGGVPRGGIRDSPKPGRSSATTSRSPLSRSITGRHPCQRWPIPWIRTSGSPLPVRWWFKSMGLGDHMRVLRRRVLALIAGIGLLAPASALGFDPVTEAQNYSKGQERQAIYLTPAYQAQLRLQSQVNGQAALLAQASDPERLFVTDLCWNGF